jgi:hypothetical protein
MFIRDFVVVFVELCEVMHPKPTWIRDHVIVLGVGLLIGYGTSLGREAKLSQCSSNLISNPPPSFVTPSPTLLDPTWLGMTPVTLAIKTLGTGPCGVPFPMGGILGP